MSHFVFPVPNTYGLYVTDPFGTRRGTGIHGGTDYRAPVGTELYAIGDGVVEAVVRNDPRGGNYVRIRLDSRLVRDARYSHMSRIDVPVGKRVRAGEIIGLSGDTGNVTGPHLHFGMKNNTGGWINPDAFLKSQNAVAVGSAPSTPRPPATPTPPSTVTKEDDMPRFRFGNRNREFNLVPNRWNTIPVTDANGVSVAFGADIFDAQVVMAFHAPEGTQVRGRFYKMNYRTGQRGYTYDRESKVDSPITKGNTMMFVTNFKGNLGPDERLRFEVYTWNNGVKTTSSAYRTLEW